MRKAVWIMVGLLLVQMNGFAQKTAAETHAKFMQLTSMFNGSKPYSCLAIVEVRYKENAGKPLRDTSKLIYKNRSTYYKSPLVERVEASEGELIVNHQLKTVIFNVSDSIKGVIYKELNVKMDEELESMLEPNVELRDLENFNKFVTRDCNVNWETKDGQQEIAFTPKNPSQAVLLSMKIRFDNDDKVRFYEYTTRDVYATDPNGDTHFRTIRTIYDAFNYDNIPNIPSKLNDFLEWNGWTLKLKKYSNYKLSVL